MIISCGYCKKELIKYQKYGKGGLINMYLNRIISSNIDIDNDEKLLICPECSNMIGVKMLLKKENELVYKMKRSTYNTRIINT